MKKKLFVLTFFLMSFNIINSQWIWLNSGTTANLEGVEFINDMTGFAVGHGVVLKTTNAGTNWTLILNSNIAHSFDIHFINPYTAFIVGGLSPSSPGILKTTNGGENWITTTVGAEFLMAISFPTNDTGYLVGYGNNGSRILKTTNQGNNWFSVEPVNNIVNLEGVYFTSAKTGYAVGHYGTILRTADGGGFWQIDTIFSNSIYRSVFFIDMNTGFIGGWSIGSGGPRLLRTTNAGMNWTLMDIGMLYYDCIQSIFFSSYNTGYLVSDFSIYKTTNSGNNWFFQTNCSFGFFDIYFMNDFTGYIVGINGRIVKTTTGGGNFVGVNISSTEIPSSPSLSQNYPNPFNPVTKIKYDIPPSKGVRGMMTKLIIYDILGREIETLVNEAQRPGSHEVTWNGSRFASGIYFYRLVADDYVETRKMVLIK